MTLDDVFMANDSPPYIHLMKIDAQGFETKILKARGLSGLYLTGEPEGHGSYIATL